MGGACGLMRALMTHATQWSRGYQPVVWSDVNHIVDRATMAAMWSLPKRGYDLETMRVITVAHRRERQAGQFDEPARETVH